MGQRGLEEHRKAGRFAQSPDCFFYDVLDILGAKLFSVVMTHKRLNAAFHPPEVYKCYPARRQGKNGPTCANVGPLRFELWPRMRIGEHWQKKADREIVRCPSFQNFWSIAVLVGGHRSDYGVVVFSLSLFPPSNFSGRFRSRKESTLFVLLRLVLLLHRLVEHLPTSIWRVENRREPALDNFVICGYTVCRKGVAGRR